jgi:hypothetical protein
MLSRHAARELPVQTWLSELGLPAPVSDAIRARGCAPPPLPLSFPNPRPFILFPAEGRHTGCY